MKISLETEQFLLENTGASKLTNISLIQNVWSNYGQILRIGLLGAETTSVVVKIIQSSAHQNILAVGTALWGIVVSYVRIK